MGSFTEKVQALTKQLTGEDGTEPSVAAVAKHIGVHASSLRNALKADEAGEYTGNVSAAVDTALAGGGGAPSKGKGKAKKAPKAKKEPKAKPAPKAKKEPKEKKERKPAAGRLRELKRGDDKNWSAKIGEMDIALSSTEPKKWSATASGAGSSKFKTMNAGSFKELVGLLREYAKTAA